MFTVYLVGAIVVVVVVVVVELLGTYVYNIVVYCLYTILYAFL